MTNGKIIPRRSYLGRGREEDDYNIKKIAGDLSDTDENLLPIFVHKFAIRLMNISINGTRSASTVLLQESQSFLFISRRIMDKKGRCNSVIRGKKKTIEWI